MSEIPLRRGGSEQVIPRHLGVAETERWLVHGCVCYLLYAVAVVCAARVCSVINRVGVRIASIGIPCNASVCALCLNEASFL